jgi:hypothetical protein
MANSRAFVPILVALGVSLAAVAPGIVHPAANTGRPPTLHASYAVIRGDTLQVSVPGATASDWMSIFGYRYGRSSRSWLGGLTVTQPNQFSGEISPSGNQVIFWLLRRNTVWIGRAARQPSGTVTLRPLAAFRGKVPPWTIPVGYGLVVLVTSIGVGLAGHLLRLARSRTAL